MYSCFVFFTYVLFILRFPIEVVLHNGESLFIDESLFIGDFNINMKLPVKVEYTVASGGHVQSIAVGKQ